MNIIHIGHATIYANGVGQVIMNLTKAQRDKGHIVTSLTVCKKKDLSLPLIEVSDIYNFTQIINDSKPDIVIFHSLYLWKYIIFYKLLNQKNIPYLIQLHGALSQENYKKSHLKKWLANFLFYKSFIKKAQGIIYLNDGEYAKSIVPQMNDKYAIIPNGVALYPIHKKPHNSQVITHILYLGRIEGYHKGLDILIEAIKLLENKGYSEKVHFDFYGTGDSKAVELFKSQIKELSKIATFHGPAYGKLKENVLANSDIFILTSRSEGMPMGVLEALAHGMPCIVTPQTNMADIIETNQCGWVTNLGANYIAETIETAIRHFGNNSTELQSNAKKAASQYSWDKIADKTISLYSDVIVNIYKK